MVVQIVTDRSKNGIRPLDPAHDLPQLASLIESAFGEELSDGGRQVLRELRFLGWLGPLNYLFTSTLGQENDIFTGFVWVQDGNVVGNITVNRPSGYSRRWQISNVAVVESCRRQGIARKLMEAAIDLILYRGGNTAYLYVRQENEAAFKLYQSMGFVSVDRMTDLRLVPSRAEREAETRVAPSVLRPLTLAEGEQLYQLALDASSFGQRWLHQVRRDQFMVSQGDLVFGWLEALFSGQRTLSWGTFDREALAVGVMLQSSFLFNRRPHRLRLWVRPDRRGQIEARVVDDVMDLLAKQSRRQVLISLPAQEQAAIDALVDHGFQERRTLILMKLDL